MKNETKKIWIIISCIIIVGLIVYFTLINPNKQGPLLNLGISILSGLVLFLLIIVIEIIARQDYSKLRKRISNSSSS